MNSPLILLILPVIISALTEVAKKYDVSPKVAVAVLSLAMGVAYYLGNMYAPQVLEQATVIIVGSMGIATGIYEYLIKYLKK